MDNNGDKREIELREMVGRYLRFRNLARKLAQEARLAALHFASITTGRSPGVTTAQQENDAMDIYSESLITVRDIDATILAMLEPYEVKFVQSCAILRKEIERLSDLADEIANMVVDSAFSIEDEGIADIMFESLPPGEPGKPTEDVNQSEV